jgi:hypothetical protein
MYALARWGARTLGPPKHDDELYPEWGLNGLPALFNGEEARGLTETYVLKIEDDGFTARIVHGSLDVSIGALGGGGPRCRDGWTRSSRWRTASRRCGTRLRGRHARRGRPSRDRSLLPIAEHRAARHCGRVVRERKESTDGTCVPPVCVSLRYDALCQMPNTPPVGSWMIAKRPIFGTSIGSLRIVAPSSFARATVASASCVAM